MTLGNIRYEFFCPVAELMRQTAETITDPAQKDPQSLGIQAKAHASIATLADARAEAFLTQHLQALLPLSKVLGEETAGDDWRLSPLAEDAGSVWIIDPIDGTKPYSRGEPYAIMVALRKNNEMDAAWIYYPHTKDMLFASREEKTHHIVWSDDGSIAAAQPGSVLQPESDAVRHIAYYVRPYEDRLGPYGAFFASFGTYERSHCIATDIRRLIVQKENFAILFVNHFTPWDHEITRMILEHAGGSVALLNNADAQPTGAVFAPLMPSVQRIVGVWRGDGG